MIGTIHIFVSVNTKVIVAMVTNNGAALFKIWSPSYFRLLKYFLI